MAEAVKLIDVATVIVMARAACPYCNGTGEEPLTIYSKGEPLVVVGWCRCTTARTVTK